MKSYIVNVLWVFSVLFVLVGCDSKVSNQDSNVSKNIPKENKPTLPLCTPTPTPTPVPIVCTPTPTPTPKPFTLSAPPKAVEDHVVINEDNKVIISVLANDSDSDGELDIASLKIIKLPLHGNAVVLAGKVEYVPHSNYHGEDSFTYSVKDNDGLVSHEVIVTIMVEGRNDIPIAYEQNLTTKKDIMLNIILKAEDSDNDSLQYRVVKQPLHGVLNVLQSLHQAKASKAEIYYPTYTYTSNRHYVGKDSFTFMVNDGNIDSNEATISIVMSNRPQP